MKNNTEKRIIEHLGFIFEVWSDGTIYRMPYRDKLGRQQKYRIAKQSNRSGYRQIGTMKNGRPYAVCVHRLVAKAFLDNYSEDLCVDHIDRDRSNNNAYNLRMVTQAENTMFYYDEQGGWKDQINKGGTSKHHGIYFNSEKGAWWCYFRDRSGKRIYGGQFKTESEAAERYNQIAPEILKDRFIPNKV